MNSNQHYPRGTNKHFGIWDDERETVRPPLLSVSPADHHDLVKQAQSLADRTGKTAYATMRQPKSCGHVETQMLWFNPGDGTGDRRYLRHYGTVFSLIPEERVDSLATSKCHACLHLGFYIRECRRYLSEKGSKALTSDALLMGSIFSDNEITPVPASVEEWLVTSVEGKKE